MKKSLTITGIALLALLLSGCNFGTYSPSGGKKKTSASKSSSDSEISLSDTSTSEEPISTSDSSGEDPTSVDPTSDSSEPTSQTSSSDEPISSSSSSTSTSTSKSTSTGPVTSSPTSASSSSSGSSSSSSEPPPDTYYAQCEGLSGSALQAKLLAINAPKSKSYDWSRYEDADEALDDSTSILCLYTRHNIKKNSHCGSYAWDKWNREHIWTQSAYPNSSTDNHNIFACEGQINNYRGNKPFAEGGNTVVVFGHTTGCKQTNSTFEPCDEAKGEVARSVMYGTVMYSYTMTNEIQSIALALKWHIQHPKTERDIRRNEIVYVNQGNRNPFVDHPEYACKIWGNTNSETKSLCGM